MPEYTPEQLAAMDAAWRRNWSGFQGPGLGFGLPMLPGLQTVGWQDLGTTAVPPPLAPAGQFYVYPDGNISNVKGPGAEGPFTQNEASTKAASVKINLPAETVAPAGSSVADAASNLSNVTKPTTPQFITPYVRELGQGAYGESDVNPFAKTKRWY